MDPEQCSQTVVYMITVQEGGDSCDGGGGDDGKHKRYSTQMPVPLDKLICWIGFTREQTLQTL